MINLRTLFFSYARYRKLYNACENGGLTVGQVSCWIKHMSLSMNSCIGYISVRVSRSGSLSFSNPLRGYANVLRMDQGITISSTDNGTLERETILSNQI